MYLYMKKNKISQNIKQLVLYTFNNPYAKIALVILIFAIALAIRLFYVLNNPVIYSDGIGTPADSHLYHRIAFNLYSGNGFSGIDDGAAYGLIQESKDIKYKPAIVRGPVYPFFIYIVYKYFSNPKDMESIETWHKNWNKVRIAQCILDATICIFVFFIVRSICPSSFWPAIISACLYCINLLNIFYTKVILSESLSTFIVAAAILLYVKALQKKKIRWWVVAGMGFGLIVLSRPEYSLALFLLAAFIFIIDRKVPSDALKKSLVFIIAAFIVIAPWTIRNFIVFKKPILVAESGIGVSLFLGSINWDGVGGWPDEFFGNEKIDALRQDYVRTLKEGTIEFKTFDNALLKMALDRIREHPGEVFQAWIMSIPHLWNQNQGYNFKFPLNIFFIFCFLFAIYGFYSGKGEEKILMAPVFLMFIYLSLIFLPLHVESRYGVALIPGIISLSGIGIWKVMIQLFSANVNHKI